jgi:hypothetical protein
MRRAHGASSRQIEPVKGQAPDDRAPASSGLLSLGASGKKGTVDVRNGLPDELLELLRKYPRDQRANDARLHGLAEGWLQWHNLFRELSVLTGGMTTDLREGRTSPTFLPLFQRRMGFLLGGLEMHHRVEDDYYFANFTMREIAETLGWEEDSVEKIIRRYVGRLAAIKTRIKKLEARE